MKTRLGNWGLGRGKARAIKGGASRHRQALRRSMFEQLETRALSAADLRALDGTGNNLSNPQWGSTDESYLRSSPAAYADGMSSPAGATRLSARELSNLLANQGDVGLVNDRNMSAFVYAWGQFLDHDIDLTDSAIPSESFPIAVPKGDAYFDPNSTGTATLGMTRSEYDPTTGISPSNPRQQINSITAFVDASQVYGSTAERAAALRSFQGGRLKTSDGNLLPFNTMGLENAVMPGAPASAYFAAGDVRANENIELTAMQTLFVREHNRLADKLKLEHPNWTDEQLYQAARRWVAAEMQVITYKEFLPALLGPGAIPSYTGYKPNINPGIANEFATGAFRFGHSMLGTEIQFLDNNGNQAHPTVGLKDSFFSPNLIVENGIDEIMKYLASDRAHEVDIRVVDDLRNFLFGPPGSGGLDLAALNIQRGRDHGLVDYNSVRVAYGLKPVKTFSEITSNKQLQATLAAAYGNVNNIDLWVGGLVEDHVPGTSLGPLFGRIIASQFQRLRDGDRFWYERDFQGAELTELRNTSLATIIRNNTTTHNLQPNVFEFRAEIRGMVFSDLNRNGRVDLKEVGLGGITVQLQDLNGNILSSTVTQRDGSYRFERLDLGSYRIRLVVPANYQQTSALPSDVVLTKGQVVGPIDFGLAPTIASAPVIQVVNNPLSNNRLKRW